ncbi:MAG: sigma-70 family RNA polymerase sigma factor [Luminiphilus sp.]|nr:sigma-70 family RNA polymerase sigma factor [Luminiphilus sp.]
MSTEAQQMQQVASGDQSVYATLVTDHLGPISAYAQRMTGNVSNAEDITQEVFLRLWLKASEFDATRARLTTWLHQMAHNLAIDQHRKRHREVSLEVIDVPDPAVPSDSSEKPYPVAQALLQLPERQRSALALTYYQDLSNREVADIMGLSTRAVESLLVRARSAMKVRLEITQ